MAAISMQPVMRSPTPPSSFDDESPMGLATAAATPLPVPNKHLATPIYTVKPNKPDNTPVTPPASPPTTKGVPQIITSSVLSPPKGCRLLHNEPPVYGIDAATTAAAIKQASCQPLPSAERVFPWLHGLHPENQVQLTFFFARKRSSQRTPTCFREVTIVKVGKDLETSKLRGAVLVGDVLSPSMPLSPEFLALDPRDGFGVRNFHIQTSKLATVSDIIVYGDHRISHERVIGVAKRISAAQMKLRHVQKSQGYTDFPVYNTFVVQDQFSTFEQLYPDIVSFDIKGRHLGTVPDLALLERHEMAVMSQASEINHNVFLGSSSDRDIDSELQFDLFIEAADQAQFPSPATLRFVTNQLKICGNQQEIEFPASGSFAASPWAKTECGAIVDACKWIYELAHGSSAAKDADGDSDMNIENTGKKILIHCIDGYTETSLLGLAYLMYAEGIPVDEAWIRMHKDKGRNFFAYHTDLQLLLHLQDKLLMNSPAKPDMGPKTVPRPIPNWIGLMDGSLPSRVLPHMYLGNLCHANNPAMLKKLGISRILSVGEERNWCEDEEKKWGADKFLFLDNLQDNGVDQLTPRLEQCLSFIDDGKKLGQATLVHCRVGVSRSATICIAEVMRRMKLSVPRAYCFVRARRLNVIIQPHLKFMYELLKWEEVERTKERVGIRRDLEWATIAREIAQMNRPYAR